MGFTTKDNEERRHCILLLGIFGINMPLLYGEGERAFTRLQEEILKEKGVVNLGWIRSVSFCDKTRPI
jgi:hypothetical protein